MNALTKPLIPASEITPKSALRTESSDAPSNPRTPYVLDLDDQFDGALTSTGDTDFVSVELRAGTSYVFSVWGRDAQAGLSDSTLRLYDFNNNSLAFNNNTPDGNRFSMIEFTPTSSGNYFLEVAGSGGAAGNYTLQVTDDLLTNEQIATYMTEFNWGFPAPLSFNVSVGGTLSYNIQGLTNAGRQLAEWAFEAWHEVTGINFVSTTSSAAQLRLDDTQRGAFAGPASFNPANGDINFSTVNIGTGWLAQYGTSIDSYSFLTYMHEIGHALGLGHAGNYDGNATYSSDAHYRNDSYQASIMSYFDQVDNTYVTGSAANPITPMIADIIAIQQLYGVGQSHHGDTVWGQGNTVGGYLGTVIAQIEDNVNAPDYNNGNVALTIYDTGGIDLVNYANATIDMTVDLTPGGTAGALYGDPNVVIAEGTILENVTTGSGNDVVTGNAVANVITTGAGNDKVEGGLGRDTVQGGEGNDTLNGGFSDDRIFGQAGNDSIGGDSAVDYLDGGAGNDTLRGGTGADRVLGGDGDDSVLGNTGVDILYGGAGNDWMSPGNGADQAFGGDGNDTIIGRTGFDTIHGDAGDDFLTGSEGIDDLYGGVGNDTLQGGTGNDRLRGEDGDDNIRGNAGSDSIIGGAGNDSLFGATGDDTIRGSTGDDVIQGNQGRDRIEGGEGNDTIYGGTQLDVFIFGTGDGEDLLIGYETGDGIRLEEGIAGAATNGQEVIDMFGSIVGDNVILTFAEDLSMTFENLGSYDGLADNILVVA